MSTPGGHAPNLAPDGDPSPIDLVIADTVNYAMQQNDVPVVHALRIWNTGETVLRDVLVRITTEPAFAAPWEVRIDAIRPGICHDLGAVDLLLSHDFLQELNERVVGTVHVEVSAGGKPACRRGTRIEVLACDEWSGLRSVPEVLAAFVLPNHPAIEGILGDAADILQEWTGDSDLSGYQRKDRERVLQTAAAIFTALSRRGIRYVSPPASFERLGQKIRLPDRLLDARLGTCLDLAVLMAGCLEQAGLHPLVVMVEGHALAGVWLDDECFADCAVDDALTLRKRVQLDEVRVFETTLLTTDTPASFEGAMEAGFRHILDPDSFSCAIDVHRARKSRIRPLPTRGEMWPAGSSAPSPEIGKSGAPAPRGSLRSPAAPPTLNEAPETPDTRLDRWKRNLLDLSLRNRLLNFRETRKTLRIMCPDLASLEDALAGGQQFAVKARPAELDQDQPRNLEVHRQRTGEDALDALLREEFHARRLHAAVPESELNRRLVETFRDARTSLEESGANTLYLALGFLAWYETKASKQRRMAPIVLVPLAIERRSVHEGFSIRQSDDDPIINTTLLEMLARDHDIDIPGMDPIPEDAHGIDVPGILDRFRVAVRDVERWEVVEEAQIGLFSFTKYLMWRDLDLRTDDLMRNRVVSHLINTPNEPFRDGTASPDPEQLDATHEPTETFCPLGADSYQLAAVHAAAAGRSFVLHGPPGTGKSHTITNMIAHALATGKTVLFVSEKMAALSVVHRRLSLCGLGPFCLELHSNKTQKREVMAQLGQALDLGVVHAPGEWQHEATRLAALRSDLNAYVSALHRVRDTGESVYTGMMRLIRLRGTAHVDLSHSVTWPADRHGLDELRELVGRLETAAEDVGSPTEHPLRMIGKQDWTPSLQADVEAALDAVITCADRLADAARDSGGLLALPEGGWSRATHGHAAMAARSLSAILPSVPAPLLRAGRWPETASALEALIRAGEKRDARRAALCDVGAERLLQLSLTQVRTQLVNAQQAWLRMPAQDGEWQRWLVERFLPALDEAVAHAGMAMQHWDAVAVAAGTDEGEAGKLRANDITSLALAITDGHAPLVAALLACPDTGTALETAEAHAACGRRCQALQTDLRSRYTDAYTELDLVHLRAVIASGQATPFASTAIAGTDEHTRYKALAATLDAVCEQLQHHAHAVARVIGIAPADWPLSGYELLDRLADVLLQMPTSPPVGLLISPDWTKVTRFTEDLVRAGRRRDELRQALFTQFAPGFLALDLGEMRRLVSEVDSGWFVSRTLSRSALHRMLAGVGRFTQLPAPQVLIQAIDMAEELRTVEAAVSAAARHAESLYGEHWRGGDPDWATLEGLLPWCASIRAIAGVVAGPDPGRQATVRARWAELLRQSFERLQRDGDIGRELDGLRRAYADFRATCHQIDTLMQPGTSLWGDTQAAGVLGRVRVLMRQWTELLDAIQTVRTVAKDVGAVSPDAMVRDLDAGIAMREAEQGLREAGDALAALLGHAWREEGSSPDALQGALAVIGRVQAVAAGLTDDMVRRQALLRRWAGLLADSASPASRELVTAARTLAEALEAVQRAEERLQAALPEGPSLPPQRDSLPALRRLHDRLAEWQDQGIAVKEAALFVAPEHAGSPAALLVRVDEALALRAAEERIGHAETRAADVLGCRIWGDKPDWAALRHSVAAVEQVRGVAADLAAHTGVPQSVLLATWAEAADDVPGLGRRLAAASVLASAYEELCEALTVAATTLAIEPATGWGEESASDAMTMIRERAVLWRDSVVGLRAWCHWLTVKDEALEAGLEPLVGAYERGRIPAASLPTVFEYSYYRAWTARVSTADPVLRGFHSREFERKIARFREVDERYTNLTKAEIVARLASAMPSGDVPARGNSEMGILKRQLQLQRRHMPVRRLLQSIRNLLPRIKPCLLMSPISVAQYLDPAHPSFDLVIFDEASQMPVWDAVGAIARGTEVVIVGDPKQLPPTSFFARAEDQDGGDEDAVEDLESILDDCMAAQLPSMHLRWHYRSRHESLIAFSNHHYYENRLHTFPSPHQEPAVHLLHVNGTYDRAKSRTNRAEAEALVREVRRRLSDPDLAQHSIGIVTFSSPQQELVEDLLDEARQQHPEIEPFFDAETAPHGEPVFVKNLENVQGDERDVILFSICYGPDPRGQVSMNFGPLNREGGHRRLNVAVTRAREELIVFTTLTADQIDLSRTRARGAADLRAFLDYAARGVASLAATLSADPDAMAESPFEAEVAAALCARGHDVHLQVGCSGYRIDIAVVDPEAHGRYLLGVECDGANYHSAKSARDRDRLRASVLEGLGWRLHRVWSTDWWTSPAQETERIEEAIRLAQAHRKQVRHACAPPAVTEEEGETAPPPGDPPPQGVDGLASPGAAAVLSVPTYTPYRASGLHGDLQDLMDPRHDGWVVDLIEQIVAQESPISHPLLRRRLAACWGIQRVGHRIAQRVDEMLGLASVVRKDYRDGRTFIWDRERVAKVLEEYRAPGEDEDTQRDAEDIAPEEAAAAALSVLRNHVSIPRSDLIRETARLFGIMRAARGVAEYMAAGITALEEHGDAVQEGGMVVIRRA